MKQNQKKMLLKIPNNIDSLNLGQLMSFARVVDYIQSLPEGDPIDKYKILDDLAIIGFGTPGMKAVLTEENADTILAGVLIASEGLFESYRKEMGNPDYKQTFRIKPYPTEEEKSVIVAKYSVVADIANLPAEIWGQILSKTDQAQQSGSMLQEILAIPYILARMSWGKEPMLIKNYLGAMSLNAEAIQEKEYILPLMNARDAVNAYAFFLIIRGVYSIDKASKFLKSQYPIQTLKLFLKESNFLKDGDGLDLSKTILHWEMKQYLEKS